MSMQTIIARARALVRAVSIGGTDDIDDWLLAAFYAAMFVIVLFAALDLSA